MIAIVGGGGAGLAAAETLRELGYDGELRLFAAETAPPYERPALSKSFLVDPEAAEPPRLLDDDALAERGIAVVAGAEVVSLHPDARLLEISGGDRVAYDDLLLATGAAPRRLDLAGSELTGVHYLRELADAWALRSALRDASSVAVIGGGVIGLEVAASAKALGRRVAVVEVAPQVMGRVVPGELAVLIEDLHRDRGVDVRTGVVPVGMEGQGGAVREVVLEDGQSVPADLVVIGVGVLPRTELAVAAGLETANGILVDERFRSSHPHIYAAGDVAAVFHARQGRHVRMEQWRPAQAQGRCAAACILGAGEPYRDIPWMWSDQHDFHIQMAGFGFDGAQLVRRGDVGERQGVVYLGVKDGRVTGACGLSLGTGIARPIRAAQSLMENEVEVDVAELADPGLDLRRLARGSRPGGARRTQRSPTETGASGSSSDGSARASSAYARSSRSDA